MLIGPGWRDHDLVFTKVDGEPVHPERLSRAFDRSVERWSLARIHLHDLRRTCELLAVKQLVHPKGGIERRGHANITIPLDVYSDVTPDMQADAADLVASLLDR